MIEKGGGEKSQIRRRVSKRESSTVEVAFRLLYNMRVLRKEIRNERTAGYGEEKEGFGVKEKGKGLLSCRRGIPSLDVGSGRLFL